MYHALDENLYAMHNIVTLISNLQLAVCISVLYYSYVYRV